MGEQTRVQGLKNFAANIKDTMKKLHEGKKLEKHEREQIIEFYRETVSVIAPLQ